MDQIYLCIFDTRFFQTEATVSIYIYRYIYICIYCICDYNIQLFFVTGIPVYIIPFIYLIHLFYLCIHSLFLNLLRLHPREIRLDHPKFNSLSMSMSYIPTFLRTPWSPTPSVSEFWGYQFMENLTRSIHPGHSHGSEITQRLLRGTGEKTSPIHGAKDEVASRDISGCQYGVQPWPKELLFLCAE